MEIEHERLYTHHALSDNERKNLTILETIRKKGPLSISGISQLTGIDAASISESLKGYLKKGLISEREASSSGKNASPLIGLNAAGAYLIGVDAGAGYIRAVLTDLSLDVKEKAVSEKPSRPEEVAAGAADTVLGLIEKSGVKRSAIKAIGIGTCDPERTGICGVMEKRTGIGTYTGTDAACAASGEKRLNAEADVENLLYMHSDVGCGIVVSGDIYFGADGGAGGMRASGEERSGAAESLFFEESKYLRPWGGDLGIVRVARREVERGVGTKIVALARGNINSITKEVVIDAAHDKDDVALDIIKSAAMNLGIRIAYLVNLFNPEAVVIGGGIEKAGEIVLGPIRESVRKFAFSKQANTVKILPSVLGRDAVSIGAATLAAREIFLKA
ncbi:MAG: ROK family transcriptional regulator [Candidatus Omnitrophota bacterium]